LEKFESDTFEKFESMKMTVQQRATLPQAEGGATLTWRNWINVGRCGWFPKTNSSITVAVSISNVFCRGSAHASTLS
jgi:hypothetical protein